jgi:replicative DNA helicase
MPVSIDELIPLYSVEAEMSTLGAMLLSEHAAEEIAGMIEEKDFYRPAHRLIFRAMKSLMTAHKPIDSVTLEEELKARGNLADVGGSDYLIEIAMYVPSAANSGFYAKIVLEKSTLRLLESVGRDIVGLVHDPERPEAKDKVDTAEQMVFAVGAKNLKKPFEHIRSLAREFFVDVDNIVETGLPMSGLKIGFQDLDDMTSGFYPGDFAIIGARPAMGKTSLVLDFALNVCKDITRHGKEGSVAIFSLEMTGIQLARRMASMLSGVSMEVLKTGKITTDHYQRLADGCDELYSLPLFIDDGGELTPLEMRGKCRRLKWEHGLNLVIIDYLQLMRGGGRQENRVQEISEIARACKNMAKELQIPVIALSQLSRAVENREDKRPQLSDIRESGSIEAEADMVMLLYRESYYKAKEERRQEVTSHDEVQPAEIIVAKHRNGPTGKVILGFQPSYARFRNLERGAYYVRESD